MLRELRVENLLLIERAELELVDGLNVLTGETGAGKTVLAHALDLILGGRPQASIVRPGAPEAYVEGVFDLPRPLPDELAERLPEDAQEVVIARRVGSDGRTRAQLNGRTITLSDLRNISRPLLTFYGQHEHRRLTLADAQLEILDRFAGPGQGELLDSCSSTHAALAAVRSRLDGLQELSLARTRELDLIDFELAEIDALDPSQEEHEALLAARQRLRRLDSLRSAALAGADAISPESSEASGSASLLARADAQLAALDGLDPALDRLAGRLHALLIESQDLAAELNSYAQEAAQVDSSWGSSQPGAAADGPLDQIEERLSSIDRLVRKHGQSVGDVLAHRDRSRARREELAGAEVALAEAARKLTLAEDAHAQAVQALRAARQRAAPILAQAVREQLSALALGDATFEVSLTDRPPGPSGGDGVEFTIAPNPGVPAGPLREIASGGELSRVMLAIMSIRPSCGTGPTLVFDEVDAGIGGHTARAVGSRLQALAEGGQVICITHLPQIASLADRHFSISKDTSAQPTRATVLQLAEPDVLSEIVRMLGADSSDSVARRHARDLIRAA